MPRPLTPASEGPPKGTTELTARRGSRRLDPRRRQRRPGSIAGDALARRTGRRHSVGAHGQQVATPNRMRAHDRSTTSEYEHARWGKDERGSLGTGPVDCEPSATSNELLVLVLSRTRNPVRESRLCASSRIPRQCEEVALPEQAVNRGHERYHRCGRMQAEFWGFGGSRGGQNRPVRCRSFDKMFDTRRYPRAAMATPASSTKSCQ